MPIRQEVLQFITACELIHGLLAAGGTLSEDERAVVEMQAIELLAAIRPGGGTSS
jgi:hypothetical protein